MENLETIISSAQNPAVKAAVELKAKKYRTLRGLYLAEGKRILADVKDVLLVVELFVLEGKEDLQQLAKRFSAPCHVVTEAVFRALSDTVNGEGIVAVVKKNGKNSSYGNRILLLDRVNDPTNVGTLLRSARAFGFNTIIGVESADFYAPKTVRGAMGATLNLNLIEAKEDELPSYLLGYPLFAADMDGEELCTVSAPKKLAMAVGNEARGISPNIVAMATKFVKIAMPGEMESLNAGVAGSIIMYHFKEEF